MKKVSAVLFVLSVMGCAATIPSQRINGRYALLLENSDLGVRPYSQPVALSRRTFEQLIQVALAERISSVDPVADVASASGYDGVIVVRWSDYGFATSGRNEPDASGGASRGMGAVSYNVLRAGSPVATGTVNRRVMTGAPMDSGQVGADKDAARALAADVAKKLLRL